MLGEVFNAFAALIFVIGLLGLFAWSLRRFGVVPGQAKFGTGTKELEILENKMIDARNKLVVARWRGTDYLLAFGADGVKEIASEKAPPAGLETSNDRP